MQKQSTTRRLAGQKTIVAACERCGGEFVTAEAQFKYRRRNGGARYCSVVCATLARAVPTHVTLACKQCGSEFTRTRRVMQERKAFCEYCSLRCRRLAEVRFTGMPVPVLAYTAGLFDGEGHITISTRRDRRRGRDVPVYVLTVVISNTDKAVLDWLHSTFGHRTVASRLPQNPRQKMCHRWILVNIAATRLLEAMLPYLHIKRERAELMIAFRKEFTPVGEFAPPLTPEAIKRREWFYRRLRELNNSWKWDKAA